MTLASQIPLAALPSPTTAVWQVGPFPIRAYALCILVGIAVACWVTERRLRQRGVAPGAVLDIAVWAVPAGIVGARIYHVVTSPERYFGTGGEPLKALYVWEGGLGIWGAVAGGAVGAWFAARQLGIPFAVVADALAPGLPLAQAVGRLGNWFNNELYGGPTTLPWGLEIHRMDPDTGRALRDDAGQPILEQGLYHPTFAYEALWNLGVAALVLLLDRRLKLGRGRAFALYVMGYTAGRFWIELMRTDEANTILGVRLNVWTAGVVFLGALVYFLWVRGPREYLIPIGEVPAPASESDVSQVDLSAREADSGPAAPAGYRVVGEEQFRRWRETGEVPPEPETGNSSDDPPADRPLEPGDREPVHRTAGDGEPGAADAADAPVTRPADHRDS
ncbi:prolipoprotein diacylglyceryl transferase [Salinispora arenicola]|uniref:Phosphatidylglycerol--prolipoprotein diacylglyceryl transferase n=2 Tax=Salinispora arenicola TaxID=168697 RepID=A0A542XPQ7_SALAC|nr:prolipoprotein diacylglyceryl transferase [Salinispora arenicola]MCN0151458.1 prolipoprotein diacylglyceryl transferase [Salinispora arenicola]MCN0178713.1 prolipoprotein diacylglyceryl transferase [Salinispora arenicola]NIL56812.1 prolipoprotein diacylglyceryl transferase [Salinispora arenicola]NIL60358.1 prolipoprotein diacylglyceryl transferase [Salinispora arenicola]TQL37838.1 prolipoprotein diacylglyceryl transferase [Salinispora arenicola]